MSAAREVLALARELGGDFLRAGARRSPEPLRFKAMTLDTDDVALARHWLARPADWSDPEPVEAYERAFAAWNGSRHAVSFLGGRVALSAIVEALGLGAGDEVIVPGYTCVVVPNALRFAGVEPVWADIELESFGLDAAGLAARCTPRTRAILVQHLYGLVCRDFEAILDFARRRGLAVIEDCAHAAGASFRGRRVGTWGAAGFVSSEVSKTFCTVQGGVAVSDDEAIARRLAEIQARAPLPDAERTRQLLRTVPLLHARFRSPGQRVRRHFLEVRHGADVLDSVSPEELAGERPAHYGARLPAPLAALGELQLSKLERYNAERRESARWWDAWCGRNGLERPFVLPESEPVFLRYPVLVEPERKRDLDWAQRQLGFAPGVWFSSQLHPAPGRLEGCPNAEQAVARCINLPTLGMLARLSS